MRLICIFPRECRLRVYCGSVCLCLGVSPAKSCVIALSIPSFSIISVCALVEEMAHWSEWFCLSLEFEWLENLSVLVGGSERQSKFIDCHRFRVYPEKARRSWWSFYPYGTMITCIGLLWHHGEDLVCSSDLRKSYSQLLVYNCSADGLWKVIWSILENSNILKDVVPVYWLPWYL